MLWYRQQSSAKNRAVYLMSSGRSLINMRNKTGPNTVPWGTPDSISVKADFSPSTMSRCLVVCVQTGSTVSSWGVGHWLRSSPLWLRLSATPSPWLPAALVKTGVAGSHRIAWIWCRVDGRRGCCYFTDVLWCCWPRRVQVPYCKCMSSWHLFD